MSARAILPAVLFFALLPLSAEATGWRCGDKLVGAGDFAIEVRAKCGEPQQVERRQKLRTLRDEKGRERSKMTSIEEWSYQRDEKELIRTLIFEDGRLLNIHIGARVPEDSSRCERQMFSRGTPAAELKLVCGEPASRDVWVEQVEREVGDGTFVSVSVTRERLVYNFGPSRFLRIFEVAEGRLVKQSTGGYGF